MIPQRLIRGRLKHLLEPPRLIIGFLHPQTNLEFDFDDDLVLFDFGEEGVALQDLVVGAFAGGAERAVAVHPTPEVLGAGHDVGGDVVDDVEKLVVGGVCGEVGVLEVGADLKQGVALAVRGRGLAD